MAGMNHAEFLHEIWIQIVKNVIYPDIYEARETFLNHPECRSIDLFWSFILYVKLEIQAASWYALSEIILTDNSE